MCKKALPDNPQHCPRCGTDLSLLNDYVSNLHEGLARAETLTRQGQLGEAMWAYLEVLEVDPDNPVARRQVGRVATAVREFDRAAPSRRWLRRLDIKAHFRRWLYQLWGPNTEDRWVLLTSIVVVLVVFFVLGFFLGYLSGRGILE
jgi:hypothetical protein